MGGYWSCDLSFNPVRRKKRFFTAIDGNNMQNSSSNKKQKRDNESATRQARNELNVGDYVQIFSVMPFYVEDIIDIYVLIFLISRDFEIFKLKMSRVKNQA